LALLVYLEGHRALIWLIRGTGVFIAGASILIGCLVLPTIAFIACRTHPLDFICLSALLLLVLRIYGIRRTRNVLAIIFAAGVLYFFGCCIGAVSQHHPLSVDYGWFGPPLLILGTLALLWLLGALFYLSITRGYDMWRRFDKSVVTDFAAIFALFAARDFHYFLPVHLPRIINEHLSVGLRDPFNDRGSRMLWTWLALYLFYKLVKASLFRVLGLNNSAPQDPTQLAPDDTEQPFMPFNPYDLSKNPPYLPQSPK
jgi:hypothetical protein